jgi:hypothetical protein
MLDEKINPLFWFIQYQASSIQYRFALSNELLIPTARRFEAKLR